MEVLSGHEGAELTGLLPQALLSFKGSGPDFMERQLHEISGWSGESVWGTARRVPGVWNRWFLICSAGDLTPPDAPISLVLNYINKRVVRVTRNKRKRILWTLEREARRGAELAFIYSLNTKHTLLTWLEPYICPFLLSTSFLVFNFATISKSTNSIFSDILCVLRYKLLP